MSYDNELNALRSGGNHIRDLNDFADKIRSATSNPSAGLAAITKGGMEQMFGGQEEAMGLINLAHAGGEAYGHIKKGFQAAGESWRAGAPEQEAGAPAQAGGGDGLELMNINEARRRAQLGEGGAGDWADNMRSQYGFDGNSGIVASAQDIRDKEALYPNDFIEGRDYTQGTRPDMGARLPGGNEDSFDYNVQGGGRVLSSERIPNEMQTYAPTPSDGVQMQDISGAGGIQGIPASSSNAAVALDSAEPPPMSRGGEVEMQNLGGSGPSAAAEPRAPQPLAQGGQEIEMQNMGAAAPEPVAQVTRQAPAQYEAPSQEIEMHGMSNNLQGYGEVEHKEMDPDDPINENIVDRGGSNVQPFEIEQGGGEAADVANAGGEAAEAANVGGDAAIASDALEGAEVGEAGGPELGAAGAAVGAAVGGIEKLFGAAAENAPRALAAGGQFARGVGFGGALQLAGLGSGIYETVHGIDERRQGALDTAQGAAEAAAAQQGAISSNAMGAINQAQSQAGAYAGGAQVPVRSVAGSAPVPIN